MSILTKWIDVYTASRAGDDLKGVTLATVQHSLPATSGDVQIPYLRSVQGIGHQPGVNVFAVGANSSIATVGWAVGSTASCPAVYYTLVSAMFHSIIR